MQTEIKIEFDYSRGVLPYTPATAVAIYDALLAVNGKSKPHAISCPADVINTAHWADAVLKQRGEVDPLRDAVAVYRPAGPAATAVRKAISTEITLKRAGGMWILVGIERVDVHPGDPAKSTVELTDRATLH